MSDDTCDHNLPLDVHCDACESAPASDPVPVEGVVLPEVRRYESIEYDDMPGTIVLAEKYDSIAAQLSEAIAQRYAAQKNAKEWEQEHDTLMEQKHIIHPQDLYKIQTQLRNADAALATERARHFTKL